MKIHKHVTLAIYLGVFVALVDQLSKKWVLANVAPPPNEMAITTFLNFVLVHNRGVTFGMFNASTHDYMPYVLSAVAFIILFFLGRWLWLTRSLPVAMGLGLVMGGAVGNVIDRVRYGFVVDFLDFYYAGHHWYAFNVADAAICTGVGLLLLDSLVRAR